jgi:hypothetical protein
MGVVSIVAMDIGIAQKRQLKVSTLVGEKSLVVIPMELITESTLSTPVKILVNVGIAPSLIIIVSRRNIRDKSGVLLRDGFPQVYTQN